MTTTEPPIKYIPCRVKCEGVWFAVSTQGIVRPTRRIEDGCWETGDPLEEKDAKVIRRHASKLRRNRNARERYQAHKDLGLNRTPSGQWE